MTSLEFFIPSPRSIADAALAGWQAILRETAATLQKAFVGLLAGSVFAIVAVAVFSAWPSIRTISLPLTYGLNSFPVVGLAPAVVLAFGQGSFLAIAFISALICYFPVLLTLDAAVQRTPAEYVELLKLFNASHSQELRLIRLPLALPSLFIALRLAAPASIIGATVGEWLGSRDGIGQLITISIYQLRPGLLYACLIELPVISALRVIMVRAIEVRTVAWSSGVTDS